MIHFTTLEKLAYNITDKKFKKKNKQTYVSKNSCIKHKKINKYIIKIQYKETFSLLCSLNCNARHKIQTNKG